VSETGNLRPTESEKTQRDMSDERPGVTGVSRVVITLSFSGDARPPDSITELNLYALTATA